MPKAVPFKDYANRELTPTQVAFCQWLTANVGVEIHPTSVRLAMTLAPEFRKSSEHREALTNAKTERSLKEAQAKIAKRKRLQDRLAAAEAEADALRTLMGADDPVVVVGRFAPYVPPNYAAEVPEDDDEDDEVRDDNLFIEGGEEPIDLVPAAPFVPPNYAAEVPEDDDEDDEVRDDNLFIEGGEEPIDLVPAAPFVPPNYAAEVPEDDDEDDQDF